MRALVNGGVRAFTDIAGWNAAVLEKLRRTGQLYVAGYWLTGAQVTNDPSLVEAKIHGNFVPAPADRVQPLAQAYAAARASAPEHGRSQPSPVGRSGERAPSMSP